LPIDLGDLSTELVTIRPVRAIHDVAALHDNQRMDAESLRAGWAGTLFDNRALANAAAAGCELRLELLARLPQRVNLLSQIDHSGRDLPDLVTWQEAQLTQENEVAGLQVDFIPL
jgi:hypothetical protein